MQATFAPDPLLFSRLFSVPRLYKGTVINDMNGHSGFAPTPQPPPSLPENLAVTQLFCPQNVYFVIFMQFLAI